MKLYAKFGIARLSGFGQEHFSNIFSFGIPGGANFNPGDIIE